MDPQARSLFKNKTSEKRISTCYVKFSATFYLTMFDILWGKKSLEC